MRRRTMAGALCILVIIFSGMSLHAQGWLYYDGSVLPANTDTGGGTLDITKLADNSPGAGMVQEIIDDPDIVGNKIFKYLHPDGKTMFRHDFDSEYAGTAYTIVARLKGENDPTYDRVFDIQWRNGNAGVRDDMRLYSQTGRIKLEKSGTDVMSGLDMYAWHTYRIAVDGATATIYVDESPVPILTGTSAEATSDKYFKGGDGSGDAIGGYVDWMAIDLSGAYAPGEGEALPAELFVDGWLIYDGSVLPADTDTGGGTLDITKLADNSPGAGMVQEIIDDPDIVGNKIFKYLHPDGKTMFRHDFDSEYAGTAYTIVARLKGENDPTYDRVFDIQWRNGNAGVRDDMRLYSQTGRIKLEKSGTDVMSGLDMYAWHTYRIAVDGATATIYVDESPVPILTGTSAEATSDKYFKGGDGSGDAIGGYVDWMAIDLSGAYAPGEGVGLPYGFAWDDYSTPVEETLPNVPTSFVVDQNYPNPFNPTTTIRFELPETQHVRVTVYNALGEEVATLIDGTLSQGRHDVQFDAAQFVSGLYFYEVKAGAHSDIKKMMLMK